MKNIKLRNVLFELDITQDWLSMESKIPKAYISQHINGRYNFTIEEEKSIAKALEMKREDLFE